MRPHAVPRRSLTALTVTTLTLALLAAPDASAGPTTAMGAEGIQAAQPPHATCIGWMGLGCAYDTVRNRVHECLRDVQDIENFHPFDNCAIG